MTEADPLPAVVIAKKRDRFELSDAEIHFFVKGFSEGTIPDYQMSALAMAVYLNGMTEYETASLTREMLNSGAQLQWPDDGVVRVDKHSTGGIGDKTSLILAPLLAECGLQVPMLSGRGLGATGGTLDKLESIPGFRTNLSLDEITRLTQSVGCVITGASAELAPADRRLYALRDVTATVPSIPLITASIMSKKLAESPGALVMDVKFGSGAFMKTADQARQLAESLVRTGKSAGVLTTALLTDMNQPLGRYCGNALEVIESLQVLEGGGPEDTIELTLALGAELLLSAGVSSCSADARRRLQERLADGSARERFFRMVRAQGGDPEATPVVAPATDVCAVDAGIVKSIETEQLGLAIVAMGGGRRTMHDRIDHSVGLQMLVRQGDAVERGQPLVRIHSRDARQVIRQVQQAVQVSDSGQKLPLIIERIS